MDMHHQVKIPVIVVFSCQITHPGRRKNEFDINSFKK